MASRAEKDQVLDFAKYCDQRVRVRFQGGREVDGILKGFDKLDNLVLEDAIEFLRDPNDLTQVTENTRKLGQVVCRGTQVSLICPSDEMEEIANPFAEEEDEDGNMRINTDTLWPPLKGRFLDFLATSLFITWILKLSEAHHQDHPVSFETHQATNMSSKLTPYEFWEKIGRPKKVVAPMVDHCELAYRMQTRKYGADLVYTQMYNANSFVQSKELRASLVLCPEDRPLIVQFAGHDPDMLLQAAKYVDGKCDAVDLNLGCPQGIAKRGRYGAFLMDEVDLLVEIVSTLVKGLSIPVTCKVRIYKDYDRTINLCEALVNAGASLLTVHGRTREEKGQLVGQVDWATIARIKQHFANRAVPIPIIANGGIECLGDVYRCIEATGCDGVMSSEGILENPALYMESRNLQGELQTQLQLTEEYLNYCLKYPVHHMKCVRSHVMKMLHRYTTVHIELRDLIQFSHTFDDYFAVCNRVRVLMKESDRVDADYTCSWYRRYRETFTTTDGEEVVVQKPVCTSKDNMVDLKTSFNHGTADGEDPWSTGEGEDCGGIFESLFN